MWVLKILCVSAELIVLVLLDCFSCMTENKDKKAFNVAYVKSLMVVRLHRWGIYSKENAGSWTKNNNSDKASSVTVDFEWPTFAPVDV